MKYIKLSCVLAPLIMLLSFAEIGYTRETAFCVDSLNGKYAETEYGTVYNISNDVQLEKDVCYYGDLNGIFGKRLITVYAIMELYKD